MVKSNTDFQEKQAERLKIKTIHQQMKVLAMKGTGMSSWEADTLIEVINDFYFNETGLKQLIPGQMRYHCVKADEPAGKPLNQCEMKTVVLTLFNDLDDKELPFREKDASIARRWRKLMRITEEAREQGGLLTQEDLAHLLMCDIRTIRRDIAALKRDGIVVPTRGTINDIGPGVTHKAIAIRLWIEGKEPTEVAKAIHHSLKAVENYLQKFMRVVYLRRKNFTDFEVARTVGISLPAVRTFLEIYEENKGKGLFKMRLEDIELVGHEYYQASDEKKDSPLLTLCRKGS